MAAQPDPKLTEALSNVQLMQGETVGKVWEADGFFVGTNPLAKMVAAFQSFMVKITGGHIRIHLVLTNMRVLLIESRKVWCGCQATKTTNTISSASIKEAGTGKESQWFCFHSREIHIQSMTQRHTMVAKKFTDEDLKDFLTHLSLLIINNTRTV